MISLNSATDAGTGATPKISVVVPLYNKQPYIQRALNSILAQTMEDYEVIVVDDGSTDDGPEVVKSIVDKRIRLISQANRGPGAARNRGIEKARGEYLAFLDADDEWMPRFLERSLALLTDYGPEVASVSSGYILSPAGASTVPMWKKRGLRDDAYILTPETSPQFAVYLLAYLCPWNTLVRADVVRRWGGFYEKNRCLYAEDAYLWLKVMLNEQIAVNLEPLVHFHSEASALSKNLRGARPVEPMLTDPAELYAACPVHLERLLKRILELRAIKTACMLSYWGKWREGRRLLSEHCAPRESKSLRLTAARLCTTPAGSTLGSAWRLLQR